LAAGALAAELVGAAGEAGEACAPGDAGLGADGLQVVGAVGAGSAGCEEPKMAETSLPKILMLSSSSDGPCAVIPHADDGMGTTTAVPPCSAAGQVGRNGCRITGE